MREGTKPGHGGDAAQAVVRRGDIWVLAGPDYLTKPRPVIVLQSDAFCDLDSVTVCLLTSTPPAEPMPLLRVALPGDDVTGLRSESWAEIDKVTTARRAKLGQRIGRASPAHLAQIARLLVVFLGFDD